MNKKTETTSTRKYANLGIVMAATLFLAGCQSELYSNLPEREVNEMISVLAINGIDASRSSDGKGNFSISVDRGDFSVAIATLSEKGLPREQFGSLGKIFNSEKLVSTPFEERARFMHALNEELSNSITRINGVVSARVHLMVPEDSPFEETKTPPRASVFIYQEAGVDLRPQIPTIKNLIVNSLDNLEYSFVEVALFDDNTSATASKTTRSVASLGGGLWNVFLLALLGIGAWYGFKLTSESSSKRNRQKTLTTKGK
jgi:type III secretion protein J